MLIFDGTNLYAVVILVALVGELFLSLVADLLNLRAMESEVPGELADVFDAETYRRSQEYTRVKTRFSILDNAFGLAVLLLFWAGNGFQQLDQWLRGFELGPVATGVAFIAALALGRGLIELPWRLYSTFVIEERFGFNRTTHRTFVVDLVKGLLLGGALGLPILALVLFFFEQTGEMAWLYCWGFMTTVTLIMSFVFPVWILPIFNRFEPLEDGALRSALDRYARSVGFDLQGIFVVDGSRRSTRSNAFFTGFGRNKRIALYDTLIKQQTVPEMVAILAHEVGHYRKRHVVKGLLISVVHSGAVFFLLSIFLQHQGLFDAFGMTNLSVYAGLVFFSLLFSPIDIVLSFLLYMLMRRHEFEADRFAAETVDEPLALASALEKLAAENLVNLTPHPFYVFLHHSHPPVLQRIRAIREVALVSP